MTEATSAVVQFLLERPRSVKMKVTDRSTWLDFNLQTWAAQYSCQPSFNFGTFYLCDWNFILVTLALREGFLQHKQLKTDFKFPPGGGASGANCSHSLLCLHFHSHHHGKCVELPKRNQSRWYFLQKSELIRCSGGAYKCCRCNNRAKIF